MKLIVLVLLCIFAVTGSVTEFNSTSRLQGKMFQKEYRDRYPFLVSLEKFGLQYCSGFVIALFKVATAAYCIHEDVETQNFSEIRAIIAYDEYKIDYGETAGCYKNLDEYPQYDFGILTLLRPAVIAEAVVPVAEGVSWGPSPTDVTFLAQWDELNNDDIQVLMVEILEEAKCDNQFPDRKNIFLDELICVKFLTRNAVISEKNVGSPLIVGDMVVGLMSGGSLNPARDCLIFTKLFEYTFYLNAAKSSSRERMDEYNEKSSTQEMHWCNEIQKLKKRKFA